MSRSGFVWELEVRLEDINRPELACQDADVVDDAVSGGICGGRAILCPGFSSEVCGRA